MSHRHIAVLRHHVRFVFCFVLLLAQTLLQAMEQSEIVGRVHLRAINCFSTEPHHHHSHPDAELIVEDSVTKARIKVNLAVDELKKLRPKQIIKVTGRLKQQAMFKGLAKSIVALGREIDASKIEILSDPEAELKAKRQINIAAAEAAGAPTLKLLSCLLVFVDSSDYGCMTDKTKARGLLFDNPTNANVGMQSLTKGHYGLQLGNGSAQSPVIDMNLSVSSVGLSVNDIEDLVYGELINLGYNIYAYDRVLIFPPGGITDASFTAYGYYGDVSMDETGLVTVYGDSYGDNRMNGYLHELGHNFGFAHSSKGSSEYGDRTCVMGQSNHATNSENYSAAKMIERNWLAPWPNTRVSLAQDTALDLYSLHIDPATSPGALIITVPGTDYFISYRIDSIPYAMLTQSGDRDKVFVYQKASGSVRKSYQVGNLAPGGTFTGTKLRVLFDSYGPDSAAKTYARVRFDVDDGNALPVAEAQGQNVTKNVPTSFSVVATDADGDALSYTILTTPTNGTLLGTLPNVIYTPNSGFIGSDSFTFKANDGTIDSNSATISLTIADIPAVTVAWSSASQVSVNESGTLTVTAQLSAASGQSVTVPFTVTGTTASADYTITSSPITIAAGSTTGTATITITADTLDEANETVILTMGTPTDAIPGATTVHRATITDDDATPTVVWTTASQASSNESGTLTVTAQLSAVSGQSVTVPFAVSGTAAGASAGADYTISSSPITIAAGSTTGTATMTITVDTLDEANETVILTMGTPTNASLGARTVHTATITDDDTVPTAVWTTASQASSNESGTLTVTAQLSAASGQSVTVPFAITGTAAGADYTITSSPITIAAGSTTGTATITITADTLDEASETVILTMGTPTNASLGATTAHTATITDDDGAVANASSAAKEHKKCGFGGLSAAVLLFLFAYFEFSGRLRSRGH